MMHQGDLETKLLLCTLIFAIIFCQCFGHREGCPSGRMDGGLETLTKTALAADLIRAFRKHSFMSVQETEFTYVLTDHAFFNVNFDQIGC